MSEPYFSIIIPVYNSQNYLSFTLDSLIAQTFKDFEVILVNDGSTDSSLEIMQNYSNADKRFKIFNQLNQERSIARNNGIRLSKGVYILFLDSDDTYYPEALQYFYVAALENYEVIYGDVNYNKFRKKPSNAKPQLNNYFKLFKKMEANILSFCIKKSFLMLHPIWFPAGRSYGEDIYFMRLVLLFKPRLKYINKFTANIRLHDNNSSKDPFNLLINSRELYIEIFRYINKNNLKIDKVILNNLKIGEINQLQSLGILLLFNKINYAKKIIFYNYKHYPSLISIKNHIRTLLCFIFYRSPFKNCFFVRVLIFGKYVFYRNSALK